MAAAMAATWVEWAAEWVVRWRHGTRGPRGISPAILPDGKKVLERISKETGGRFFEVSKKQSIDQIYASIEEELRNQYSLGYTPDKADAHPAIIRSI